MWIGIEDAAYFLPGKAVCVKDWVASINMSSQQRERIEQGGYEYHYPGTGQSLGHMCEVALRRLIDSSGLRPADVDMIIYIHALSTSIGAPPQSMVAALARDFQMHRANAFSISNLHCVGVMGALRIARNLMAVESDLNNVVMVTADTHRGPEVSHDNASHVPSEGAAAIWVKRNCLRNRIGAITIETAAQLHMGYAGTPEQHRLFTMTSQVYSLRVVKDAIKRSGLAPEAIVKLVPANTGLSGWRDIAKRFKVSQDFVYECNFAKKGHVYCSDVIINLLDGGFLDHPTEGAIVVAARGAAGVYGAFVLQAAC